MADTAFGTNDAQTVQRWAKMLWYQIFNSKKLFNKFLGTSETDILYYAKDLSSPGDTVKFDLLVDMGGDGVTGDNKLTDNEEALTYYNDQVKIDQLRQGHRFKSMSQQRTIHDLRSDGKWALGQWWAKKLETFMFRRLAGDTTLTHGEAGTAPDSGHHIFCGDATSNGDIDSADQFSLEEINYAAEIAETSDPAMRMAQIDGEECWVCVLHPYSVTDLKLGLGAGSNADWQTIQMGARSRGSKHPLFTGALGKYENTLLLKSNHIYSPATNVRSNVFLGAQAGVFALGNAYSPSDGKKYTDNNYLQWNEEITDHGNRKAMSAGMKFNINKCTFNSKDYSVIVIGAYAAEKG